MNLVRKSSLLVSALLLAAAAVLAVSCHHKVPSEEPVTRAETVSHAEVMKAVPSDAALVMCFQNARSGLEILTDKNACFGTLLSGSPLFRRFISELSEADLLKSQHMAVSLHFTGSLEPLMALDFGKSQLDTAGMHRKLLSLVESSNLSSAIVRQGGITYMIISASGTMVNSSKRHLEGNISIMEDKNFATIARQATSREVIFLSNGYADKVMQAFLGRPLRRHAEFVKKAADWTAFDIKDFSKSKVRIIGRFASGEGKSYYTRILKDNPSGDCRFAEAVPESATFALSQSVTNLEDFYKSYTDYLDANSLMGKHQTLCDSVKRHLGVLPLKWGESLGVCEVVSAEWKDVEGNERSATIFRASRQRKNAAELLDPYCINAISALFGNIYASEDVSTVGTWGEWYAAGDEESVTDWSASLEAGATLESYLGEVSVPVPARSSALAAYFSLDRSEDRLEELFRPVLASDISTMLEDVSYAPVVMSCGKDGFEWDICRISSSERNSSAANKAPAMHRLQVEVPTGPFKVVNSATGRNNLFYQNKNLALCLKEESGKGLWGVPFSKPLCGYASNVDYFDNGKLQIIFAAGSSIYLIDRTGHFVKGFPKDLGKDVLLGPVVSGEPGSYSLMVLHKDNTVGVYDIDGNPDPEWLGVACEESMLSMPYQVSDGERSCWVVRTPSKTLLFGPHGGDTLYDKTGKKAIRRDSEVEITGKGTVTFTCTDGKKRNIKF